MGAFARVISCTWAGFRRRCPSCRRDRMYSGMYQMREACPSCGLVFEPSPGEFTGALMLAQGGFGTLAAVGFVALWLLRAQRAWLYAWLGLWLILMPILLYPNVKGAWLGFLYGVRSKVPDAPGVAERGR